MNSAKSIEFKSGRSFLIAIAIIIAVTVADLIENAAIQVAAGFEAVG